MRTQFQTGSAVLSSVCTVALLLLVGAAAYAQSPEGSKSSTVDPGSSKSAVADMGEKFKDVKISLISDQGNLLDAIRTLMKSAGADFTIDDELKAGSVTVHFKDVMFRDALATLIKVSTLPIKYEIKDGIYHFMRRIDPPAEEEKPSDSGTQSARAQPKAGRIGLDEISAAAALRKLTGKYDAAPPMLYQHSSLPGSHGSTSGFGLGGGGLLQSNGVKFNPDGSISRTSAPPLNIFGLLRGLLSGLR